MLVSNIYCRRAPPGHKHATRWQNASAFGALKFQENRPLTRFANAQGFGALTVMVPGQLSPTRFANAQSFGALKFQGNRTLTEFVSPESFVAGASIIVSSGGDPWSQATMTAPPTVAGGTWTTVYDTSSSPTPHFEDFTAGVTGVRLRILTTLGNAAGHLYGAFQSRPSGAYDLIACFRVQKLVYSQWNGLGLMLRESGTGKLMIFGWHANTGGIGLTSWSGPHTFSHGVGLDGDNGSLPTTFAGWLKIHDDHAGNLTFYASLDGNYWVTFGSKAYTATGCDFTTAPDQVGWGINTQDESTGAEIVLDCASFFAG
jgi:hypothetical protein